MKIKIISILILMLVFSSCSNVNYRYEQVKEFRILVELRVSEVVQILTLVITENRPFQEHEITRLAAIKDELYTRYDKLKADLDVDTLDKARNIISILSALIQALG